MSVNTSESFVQKLRSLLYLELLRSDEKIDQALVLEYSRLIAEVEGHSSLTKSEIKKRSSAIIDKCFGQEKYSKSKIKTILIAACIAILVLITALTSLSYRLGGLEALQRFGHRLLEMSNGDSFSVGDVEVFKGRDGIVYDSPEAFFEDNDLKLMYPGELPCNAYVDQVYCYRGNGYTTVTFRINVDGMYFGVYCDRVIEDVLLNTDLEKEEINSLKCYITRPEDHMEICFFHNGNTYKVVAETYEDARFIIENLKES